MSTPQQDGWKSESLDSRQPAGPVGGNTQPPQETVALRLDRLINTALDAEATGDFDAANLAWAKIAALDANQRRSAAALHAGLEQLRAQQPRMADVTAKVLARAGIHGLTAATSLASHHAVGADAAIYGMPGPAGDAISTPTPHRHRWSSGVVGGRRRWFSLSPVLAGFVLGGLVTLGLVVLQHRAGHAQHGVFAAAPLAGLAELTADAARASSASESTLLVASEVPAIAERRSAMPLRLGDVSRYSLQAQVAAVQPHGTSHDTSGYAWWRDRQPGEQVLASERPLGLVPLAGLRADPGDRLLRSDARETDLFGLMLGEPGKSAPATTTMSLPATNARRER